MTTIAKDPSRTVKQPFQNQGRPLIKNPIPRCPPPFIPHWPIDTHSPTVQRHNFMVARSLKGSIDSVLDSVHLRKPLLPSQQPHDVNGHMVAPNGNPLIKVKLESGQTGYVDPKTNEFYVRKMNTLPGKKAAFETWEGPYALPKNAQFQGKNFTEKQLAAFEVAANTTWRR